MSAFFIVEWLMAHFGDEIRMIHTLKTWPDEFEAVARGEKRHEVRRFDRDFEVGDWLLLSEWDPRVEKYTGRQIFREIIYITPPGSFGLPDDLGVMSVR